MNGDYLFVYGTLKKNSKSPMRRSVSSHAEFIGQGCIQGKLFEIGGYPGAVISGSAADKVQGDLFRMAKPEKLFRILDEYEECSDRFPEPREYKRVKVKVLLHEGGSRAAWAYIYNRPVFGLKRIKSGNYRV
ncbi:MAG: gamma-glutamylcyclotransferase family protein [Gammaproteobacteria bacterium]